MKTPEAPMLTLQVARRDEIARDIVLFDLVPAPGQGPLPPFEAGAHIPVLTPSGLTRRYSLCNSPAERQRYQIAVKRESQGLGGSRSMVEKLNAGDLLQAGRPENLFPLDPSASRFLLLAGGIGITPILSMVHALAAEGMRSFRLVYCARSAETTAFGEFFSNPSMAAHCVVHHDQGDPGLSYDFAGLLAQAEPGTHLYCCGPVAMMQAVRALSRHWPAGSVHFEDFGSRPPAAAAQQAPQTDRAFTVRLARAGLDVMVPAGTSILQALRARGVPVPSSCEAGTCGACRTGVLEGEPDHRDYVIEEDATDEMLICVSRARSEMLVLDL